MLSMLANSLAVPLAASATSPLLAAAKPAGGGTDLNSLFDMVVNGGPMMIPIGICSVISLAYVVERSIRLRKGRLFNKKVGARIVEAVRDGGAVKGALACDERQMPMTAILRAGLIRHSRPPLEIEKAVEDEGYRQVKRLSANLRPMMVIGMITPLLGLLGTVWGMIQAFSNIALKDGLGKPEMLASGISQALITTAAGLAVAIPTQAAYFYYRSRVDRFVRNTEDLYVEISESLLGSHPRTTTPTTEPVAAEAAASTVAAAESESNGAVGSAAAAEEGVARAHS